MNRKSLPRRLEDLRGRTAARWIRESSSKQGDKYGPGAQRTMEDRAVEQYGLVDTTGPGTVGGPRFGVKRGATHRPPMRQT